MTIRRSLFVFVRRVLDFCPPALPGTVPGPGQDRPSLPAPAKVDPTNKEMVFHPSEVMTSADAALRRSTDWRAHRLWNWISGGGWKGLLGARRFWGTAVRYMWDGLGKIAWTFRLVAVIPLEYATRRARQMSTSIVDFRRMRDAGLLHLPLPTVRRRIFFHGVVPPMTGGVVFLVETLILRYYSVIPVWEGLIDVIVAFGAIGVPLYFFVWCQEDLPLHLAGQKWPPQTELEKIRNSAPFLAGFGLPSFVNSSPDSYASCILYTLFGTGSGASSGSCSSAFGQMVGNSTVVAAVPPAISAVASLVSILALFILTLTYTYHVVSAMHTAAHTGDWTHEGVNAAWAPLRGSLSAAMIAAPGGLSILGGLILFVAMTGNGVGDTASNRISAMLTSPPPGTIIPPSVQVVADNALYSLVCAHVLDNFTDPHGTVTSVTPQPDTFGGLGFSNIQGVGEYGPNVCGDYILPGNSGQTMAGNTAFLSLVQAGGPLDTIAAAIASGANGCGSVVIGTGLSPCAPPGTPENRQVFATGGGITNPAGTTGGMTQAVTQYMTALGQMAATATPDGGNALQKVQQDGWMSLGSYYSFFAEEARRASQYAEWLPEPVNGFGGADWTSISGSEAAQEVQTAFRLTQTYLASWGFSGQGTGPWWAAVPQATTGPGADQAKIQSLSSVQDKKTGKTLSVPAYMAANPGEDPLSRLQGVVESADTALAVGATAVAGLSSPGVQAGLAALGPVGAAVDTAGGVAAKAAKPVIRPLTSIMAILTVIVAVYLPLLPMLAVLFYGLFWVMEVSILTVFAPLWALAVGIPQGDGFVGHHGRAGLLRVMDIALRPLLIVGKFVISLALYFIASALLVPMTSQVLQGMASGSGTGTSPGIWISAAGLVGGYLAYTLVLWRVLHFAFEILHTGPYWALKLLGIEGDASREGRHMETGGREILTNIRMAVNGLGGQNKT